MKKLVFLIKPISICLVIVVFANSIGHAMESTIPNAQTKCGEWIIENTGSSDPRISVTRVQAATGNNCQGIFTLSNQTGPVIKTGKKLGDISLGGYSFDLWPSSNNANYQLTAHDYPVLIPGLPLDITTTPIDISITGVVSIQTELTPKSASVDASLFFLKSIIDVADLPCAVSYNQLSYMAVRTAPLTADALKLAFEGKMIEFINAVSRVSTAYGEQTIEAAKEIGLSCLAEWLIKKPYVFIKIGLSYAAWVGTTLIDYFKYNGTGGPLIILSYIPPKPPTPTIIQQSPESVLLDTRNVSARSTLILQPGQTYSITMSGTYSHWAADHWTRYGVCWGATEPQPMILSPGVTNGNVDADPKNIFAHPNQGGTCANGKLANSNLTISPIYFSIDGENNFYLPNPIGNANSINHTYQYSVIGRGFQLVVKLVDALYDDNYGQIKITIDPQ